MELILSIKIYVLLFFPDYLYSLGKKMFDTLAQLKPYQIKMIQLIPNLMIRKQKPFDTFVTHILPMDPFTSFFKKNCI